MKNHSKSKILPMCIVFVIITTAVSGFFVGKLNNPEVEQSDNFSSNSWYDELQSYAESQGKTVDELTEGWNNNDWQDWFKYEGNPSWGSTNITDTFMAADWLKLPNTGNITWGADYDIEAYYNSTSNRLEWTGVHDNFSAFNLKCLASYILWMDGSTFYATNGSTGLIDYSGTDAATVIQNAIDAIHSIGGGKIVLGDGRFNLGTQPTYYDNITIEGQGSSTVIVLTADIVPFQFCELYRTHARNLDIEVSDGHTEAILELLANTSNVRYCSFENINILNPYATHNFTAIRLRVTGSTYILENKFEHIYIGECNKGIHFDIDNVAGWENGNHFNKIWAEGYVTFIDFDYLNAGTIGNNRNTFIDCKAQTKSYSLDGIKNIRRYGNIFIDCLLWDWHLATAGNYPISIHSEAGDTFILDSVEEYPVQDNGSGTQYIRGDSPVITGGKIIRTVMADFGYYKKLSEAFQNTNDASASKRYILLVMGKITEDSQINAKSYVNVIGFNAEVEIASDSTIHGVEFLDTHNAIWRDITIKRTGANAAAGLSAIRISGASCDETLKLFNVRAINEMTGGNYHHGMFIFGNSHPELRNCYGKGADNEALCVGILVYSSPKMYNCKGEGGSGGTMGNGWLINIASTALLKDCVGLAGEYSGSRALSIELSAAPTIDNFLVELHKFSTNWCYSSANSGQFRPYAGKPYQLVAIIVWVLTANAGVTLDLGTTIGGSEIASGIDIGTTGWKTFDFTKAEVVTDGYMYATPSAAISDNDIRIDYAVISNYDSCVGIYLNTKGEARIIESSIFSNGASDAVHIVDASNFKIINSHLETYDPTNQHAIYAASPMTGENIKGCSIIGKIGSITGIDNKASGTATFSGDGSTTAFNIAHGLVATPSSYQVQEASADAGMAEISHVTADSTNLIVTFKTAPASGTDNVKLAWSAEV